MCMGIKVPTLINQLLWCCRLFEPLHQTPASLLPLSWEAGPASGEAERRLKPESKSRLMGLCVFVCGHGWVKKEVGVEVSLCKCAIEQIACVYVKRHLLTCHMWVGDLRTKHTPGASGTNQRLSKNIRLKALWTDALILRVLRGCDPADSVQHWHNNAGGECRGYRCVTSQHARAHTYTQFAGRLSGIVSNHLWVISGDKIKNSSLCYEGHRRRTLRIMDGAWICRLFIGSKMSPKLNRCTELRTNTSRLCAHEDERTSRVVGREKQAAQVGTAWPRFWEMNQNQCLAMESSR